MAPNAQKLYPVFDKDIPPSIQSHLLDTFTGLNDHDAAIVALNDKVNSIVAGSGGGTVTNVTNITTGGGGSGLAGLGKVNMQSTDYSLQTADAGSLVTMTSGVATTITLNFTVSVPFFCFVENFGTADVALTPNNGALINGVGSIALRPDFYAVLFFDNSNWEAALLPTATLNVQTNGVANSDQTALNLTAGANITLTAGAGGLVTVAASGALSLLRVPHVVTGSRALGGIYQNTTGGEMVVSGYGATSGGSTGALEMLIGTVSPSQQVWAEDYTATLGPGRAGFSGLIVPNNYFYMIRTIAGAGSAITGVGLWVEFY